MKTIKKVFFFVSALCLIGALAACGSTTPPVQTAKPTASPGTSSPQANKTWPAAEMGAMPNPNRDIYTIARDNTGTSVDIIRMSEDEVRAYIDQVKAAGFEGEVTELGSGGIMFMGYNDKGENARVIQTNTQYTVITFRPKGAPQEGATGTIIDNATSSATPTP